MHRGDLTRQGQSSVAVDLGQGECAKHHMMQAMLHMLGEAQQHDLCLLTEDREDSFLELAMTSDGAYVTINSNSKSSSEVWQTFNSHSKHHLDCASP